MKSKKYPWREMSVEGVAIKVFVAITIFKMIIATYVLLSSDVVREALDDLYYLVRIKILEQNYENRKSDAIQLSNRLKNRHFLGREGKLRELLDEGDKLVEDLNDIYITMGSSSKIVMDNVRCVMGTYAVPLYIFYVLAILLPSMLYSKWLAIAVAALAAAAEFEYVSIPVPLFERYGLYVVSSLLEAEYSYEVMSFSHPLPLNVVFGINVVYLTAIAVIFALDISKPETVPAACARDVWRKWNKLRPRPDTRFRDFMEVCANGDDKALLRALLNDATFNPNQVEKVTGDTGLHASCRNKQFSVVQSILDVKGKAVNVNVQNCRGWTPLALASARGDKRVTARLLKERRLRLKHNLGEKAVRAAIEGNHYTVARMVADEMAARGVRFRDAAVQSYIARCAALAADAKKKEQVAKEESGRPVTTDIYKSSILRALKESEGMSAIERLPQDKVIEELRDYLECSICFELYGEAPIWSCDRDHWLCKTCVKKNEQCPWCQSDFRTEPPKRRRTSEKILQLIRCLK